MRVCISEIHVLKWTLQLFGVIKDCKKTEDATKFQIVGGVIVILSTIMIALFPGYDNFSLKAMALASILEYALLMICNNCAMNHRRMLFNKIQQIDRKLQTTSENYKINLFINIQTSIFVAINLILLIYYEQLGDNKWNIFITIILLQINSLVSDLEGLWRLYLVLLVKCRLECIHHGLMQLFPFAWYDRPGEYVLLPTVYTLNMSALNRFNLPVFKQVTPATCDYLDSFKILADSADLVSKNIQFPFVMKLGTLTSKVFLFIYMCSVWNEAVNTLNACTMFEISVSIIATVLPCVVSEMSERTMKKIKTLLICQTFSENVSDEEKHVLHRFIRLISLRSIRYTLYGTVAVDADLMKGFLNICATYVIFIMQSANYRF